MDVVIIAEVAAFGSKTNVFVDCLPVVECVVTVVRVMAVVGGSVTGSLDIGKVLVLLPGTE